MFQVRLEEIRHNPSIEFYLFGPTYDFASLTKLFTKINNSILLSLNEGRSIKILLKWVFAAHAVIPSDSTHYIKEEPKKFRFVMTLDELDDGLRLFGKILDRADSIGLDQADIDALVSLTDRLKSLQ